MKKILSFIIVLVMLSSLLSLVSFAESGRKGVVIDNTSYGYIGDEATARINNYIDAAYEEYACSIVIVYKDTVPDDDDERDYEAEEYYRNGGFCENGVIFYLGTQSRSFDIYCKYGNDVALITSSEGDSLNDEVMEYLPYNDFEGAAVAFAAFAYDFAGNDETEKYVMNGMTSGNIVSTIVICFLVALVISLVIVFIMKSRNKTVKPSKNATDYIVGGSSLITLSKDQFLYSTVSKIRKAEQSSSSHSGGGGGGGGSHHGGHF